MAVGSRRLAGHEVQEGECRGHPGGSRGSPGEHVPVVTGFSRVSGVEGKIFMQESDALNFLKKRGKRSSKSREEVNGKDAGGLPSALASCSFSLPQSAGPGTKGST